MSIEYVEIRSANTREIVGIVDLFESVIWHTVWYGVGDFEVYAKATESNLALLKEDNYITKPNSNEIGIIEKVNIVTNIIDGKIITATGRLAKSILDRRLIYNLSGVRNKATVLSGNVESAARRLVYDNAIGCTFDTKRNISFLELGANAGITKIIVDEDGNAAEKQVSYQNLLEYSDELLQEYELSSKIIIDDNTKKLQFIVKEGADRSADNNSNNEPIVFSSDFDNLSESNYTYSKETFKNCALIGGEGEGLQRFYSTVIPSGTGLARRELFVDASSLSKSYMDENDQQQTYTNAQYNKMLKLQGKQQLATLPIEESFSGTIIVSNSNYVINEDFSLGDIVTIQENSINKFINVRITEVTEVQDGNGYTVDVVYK